MSASLTDAPLQQSSFMFEGRSVQPWNITTPEFGSQWGQFRSENKTTIGPSSVRTLVELSSRVTGQLSMHMVEMISATNEGIVAGQLSNSDTKFCMHIKLRTSGQLDVAIRAPNQSLVDALAIHCQQVLK
jgi:hypothetical protein